MTDENSNLRDLIKIEINYKTLDNVADDVLKYGDQVVGGYRIIEHKYSD